MLFSQPGKNNDKSESSAHVIRHKDRYTILLKPLPIENYSNFEVSLRTWSKFIIRSRFFKLKFRYFQISVNGTNTTNNNNLRAAKLLGNIMKNDTISLTVKPT